MPFPPPACTSKKIPDTRKKCRSSQTGAVFFCLFVCSLIQLHLGSFVRLFFLLIDFKSRPHGAMFLPQSRRSIQDRQHPAQRPAALLGPPDHSIDRAVDACDGIQHPDFPLLLKNAGRNLSRLCPHVRILIPHSGAHLSRQSPLCVCSFLPRTLLRVRGIQGIIKFPHTQDFPKKCRNFQFGLVYAEFCYRMTFHRL